MASIRLTIVDPAGSKSTSAEVPDNAPMRRLIPALVTKMQLPTKDAEGNLITYQLHRIKTASTLADKDTITSSGAEEGETFALLPGRILGGPRTLGLQPAFETPDQEVADAVDLSAPVYIPTRDSLAIGLVPTDTVYRLEEYRSDQMRWESIMWAFIGAVLGVIVNWVTADPIVISRVSVIVIAVFVVMVAITWLAARDYKKRAEGVKSRIGEFRKSSRLFDKSPK